MADQNDLTRNATLYDENGNQVGVILDGSTYRLSVDAKATIVDNESPTRYQLKTDFDASPGDTLNTSTDTVLFTYTGDGVIDFISIAGSNASYEVAVEIDGTERIRISMSELGTTLGLSNATNVDMWVETANKNFRYRPQQIGFTTGFRVLAKATGTPLPTVYHLIIYRERT
jgi:hypothetical protein